MGNILTPEVLSFVLNIVLAALGWRIKVSRDKAKDRAEDERVKRELAEAEIKKIEAEIERVNTENKIKLIEAESKAKREAEQSELIKQINTERIDWLNQLKAQRVADEENYQGLKGLQDTQTKWLTTEIQTQGRRTRKSIDKLSETLTKFVDSIPEHMQKASAEMVNGVAVDLGMTITQQMALQSMGKDYLHWPYPDDAGWEDVMIQAVKEDVRLRKSPQYGDDLVLKEPKGTVHTHPFAARIIRNRIRNWWIVEKKQNGDPAGYGYVEEHWVKISEQVSQPA